MKILCTICARGGSKGVKNKNIKLLNGKNLISYTIDQAKKSNLFNQIVVSTDSIRIQKIAKKYKANCWFLRKKNLSTDSAAKIPVIQDTLLRSEKYFKIKYDYIIDLDPTSPLRSVNDIISSFKKFISKKADLLITGCEAKKNPYFNMFEIKNSQIKLVKKKDNKNFVSRQLSPKVYEMNASIYIWNRNSLIRAKTLFIKNMTEYIMPYERSIDIDSELDFKIVELLLNK